jgi:hypothetical protein
MLASLRRIHPLAFWSLGMALVGVLADAGFHFLRPEWIPVYARWLASLSEVDQDFFRLTYELVAHFIVALGLTGLVSALVYQQIRK